MTMIADANEVGPEIKPPQAVIQHAASVAVGGMPSRILDAEAERFWFGGIRNNWNRACV